MNEDTRHKLLWGWLRLLLGTIQIVCAPLAIYALLLGGVYHPVTLLLIAGATLATIISWLLYHGRSDLRLNKEKRFDE
ncbi:MAG TPA: hypothetical protein VGN95_11095 [Pyrinomonadaceae bacterium]|nr:hypothetical protein [Pyrinomonadaceae bacterium]